MDTKLVELIQRELIGSKYKGSYYTESVLSELTETNVRWYNITRYDVTDDDGTEDNYIKRCSFTNDKGAFIHVFYGDVTKEICNVDVCEAAL